MNNDTNVNNPDDIRLTQNGISQISESLQQVDTITCLEAPMEANNVIISEHTNSEDSIDDDSDSSEHEEAGSDISLKNTLTKRGTIRKRKMLLGTPSDRKKKKEELCAEKHSVLPGCKLCFRKCAELINEERRQEINNYYWQLSWHEKKIFVLHNTSKNEVQRRYKLDTEECYRKMSTYRYFFKDKDDKKLAVCKTFFLTTLGFKKNCDWIISSLYNKNAPDTLKIKDGRGRQPCPKKLPRQDIKNHIMSFNPITSHYRREHAPLRLYLPSDINISLMYTDFKEKFPNLICSYDLYRQEVRKLNIAFTKLGNEECEKCEEYAFHDQGHTKKSLGDNCEICKLWKEHLNYVEYTRTAYKKDVENANNIKSIENDSLAVSADLQKVIMLPRIDMFKKVLFTKRICVYNESFVPLGNQKKHFPLAILWHEGIAGRKQEEIISSFHQFLKANRDKKDIIIWTDNCTSQNKNWALISSLIYLINTDEIGINKLHVKYFEPGHSFMSADSFHHQVELSLKRQKKTYDFNDFTQAVKTANNGKVVVECVSISQIADWKNCCSITKINKLEPRPYLRNISEIIFKKGSLLISYRTFENDKFLTNIDLLQEKHKKKFNLMKPILRNLPCGISEEKKKSIIQNLGPLMPNTRLAFWENIETDQKV